MPSIQYISNGVTCCIPLSTTQASHPSLSVYNNGTQYYAAMTTAALPGVHVCNNGINYSIGAPEEEGGVRIHSNYVCIACAYNFNTLMCVCFCTDDSDWEFELGLNPTYGTASNGWATVTWNSKNCTGTSPTIEEHFQCMCAHSTAANAITYWGTTLPSCWNYVNCCLAAGCDLDPKDGSSVLCTSYTLCVNDNCYWSQDTDFCYSSFNNHAAWSSCSWCKGCKPIGCWSSVDYYSYNMNRTSGTMSVSNGSGCSCCLNYKNNNTYSCTTYCNWQSCSEDSYGWWICCGWLKCIPMPNAYIHLTGSVPSAITVCTYAYNSTTGSCVNIVSAARSFSWNSTNAEYVIAQPSFRFGSMYCASITGQAWSYCACTDEYVSTNIREACIGCVYVTCTCASQAYSPNVQILGGRWSDGSTSWTPTCKYINLCSQVLWCYCSNSDICRYVRAAVNSTCYTGSKSWQTWLPPTLVHCAW